MSNANFWNEDWMKLQQQYWQQLGEMSQKAMGAQQDKGPWNAFDWEQAMSQWWKAVSPGVPDSNQGFMDKMLEQGKVFYRMNEEFTRNLDKSSDWTEALTNTFEQLQSLFASQAEQASGSMETGYSKLMGFWQAPMENWRQMTGFMDFNNDFAHTSNLLEKLLDAPGLGYTREDENCYKQLMQAGLHYQHALMDYNRFFSDIGTQSVSHMKNKVKSLADDGKRIDSGRALYDLWVSACEEVYTEHTLTPEYAKVHGELVNALMAFKQQWEELIDQRLGMLNMPTRREMRTLQTRLQESRRETRSLRSEINQLKEDISALQQQQNKPASQAKPATATKRKTTTKKKVSKKKATARKA